MKNILSMNAMDEAREYQQNRAHIHVQNVKTYGAIRFCKITQKKMHT